MLREIEWKTRGNLKVVGLKGHNRALTQVNIGTKWIGFPSCVAALAKTIYKRHLKTSINQLRKRTVQRTSYQVEVLIKMALR